MVIRSAQPPERTRFGCCGYSRNLDMRRTTIFRQRGKNLMSQAFVEAMYAWYAARRRGIGTMSSNYGMAA